MKVIFLDIDGVLNCPTQRGFRRGHWGMQQELVDRYKRLVQATGAKTVISSTWRLGEDTLDQIRGTGIAIHGITPDLREYNARGHEIDEYLRTHPNVEQYAVIDDDAGIILPHQPFFQTDWRKGLSDELVWRIIQHFAI